MRLKHLYSTRKAISIVLIILGLHGQAQDSTNLKLRRTVLFAGNGLAYTGAMSGLYFLWYKDYEFEKFHFFNDNKQWLQMDKLGHSYSCYYEGLVGIEMMKWAGYNNKTASICGGSYGFIVQLGVEVFDGFSTGWGASSGDLLANALGSGLAVSQGLIWDDQRIKLKFSYSNSPYAKYRPNTLGSNFQESLFKDYNGQTYWLSVNVHSFFPESRWPKWLAMDLGYGAEGMIGGSSNLIPLPDGGFDNSYLHISRNRQFYFSPDIDLSQLQTKSKALKTVLLLVNCLKFPAPTLEYNNKSGFKGHWIHY